MLMTRSDDFSRSARFHLKSAVHLFLMRGDEILLLRRHHTGYEDGNYSVIAGHLEGGEQVKHAMKREAREEAGIEIDEADLEIAHVMHRKSNDERIDFFLRATRWRGEPVDLEPHKCDELRWCRVDDLPANTIPYVRQAIENVQHDVTFSSFGWDE
jgi:8-oxo-dGTP pyrophosphatase MutT (NUDIX family)